VDTIILDGHGLDRAQLVRLAEGKAQVALDPARLAEVDRCASFLASQVTRGEPIYGVTTGFGSNADRLLGAHRARDELPGGNPEPRDEPLTSELQRNLVISHAVCVGEPLPAEIVRAMLAIRINTLLRGHSGLRASTVEALAAMLNAGIVPIVPRLGSVGASGDLAPLSHLAIVLLGGGEAWYGGIRMRGDEALRRAGLRPISLSFKEGLALNNGTAQMLACAALALDRLERVIAHADLAAAMTIEAFAGRGSALREDVHALRPHPGQVETARRLRQLVEGSTLVDIAYHLVPRFRPWHASAWPDPADWHHRFDLAWDWVPSGQRHGREAFYTRFLPFRGGKKHQPQDAYSLRCTPQVHGAVRDALAHAARVVEVELNAVTDNPLIFPDHPDPRCIEDQVVSAGHFHGMPIALAMSALKAAIPVLASISERRLNKLVDPATNDGLPAFLVGNEDATDSGVMIIQYTAAAIVNDLASRAHPASVYSIPTSANAEDHVSMGANEARHALDMVIDAERVIALELMVAAQALDYRRDMLNAARALAAKGDLASLANKVENRPETGTPTRVAFDAEVGALAEALASAGDFHPGPAVATVHAEIRRHVGFVDRDRALDRDVRAIVDLVASGALMPLLVPLPE
jgi:histidine ammonia-lyase